MSNRLQLLRSTTICASCGCRIFTRGLREQNRLTTVMKRRHICYECAFWEDLIEYPPQFTEVLGCRCIKIYPGIRQKELGVLLGGKGKTRYFARPDWQVLCSNDIWLIGEIPTRYRSRLKPTLFEITSKAYKQLKRNNKQCQARACLDRYNCFRFNVELERENGPYNSVPKNWKVGSEHCGFRIDPSEILTDDCSANKLL